MGVAGGRELLISLLELLVLDLGSGLMKSLNLADWLATVQMSYAYVWIRTCRHRRSDGRYLTGRGSVNGGRVIPGNARYTAIRSRCDDPVPSQTSHHYEGLQVTRIALSEGVPLHRGKAVKIRHGRAAVTGSRAHSLVGPRTGSTPATATALLRGKACSLNPEVGRLAPRP